jgi:tRNA 2-thiouridine synthesizing protein E
MGYKVEGQELEADAEGYLLEADLRDETCMAIAEAEGIALTDAHWEVIRHLRDEYQANGHSPNFRALLKGLQVQHPELDSKALYDLFPVGPAKQGAKIAGLPQPFGKGGY